MRDLLGCTVLEAARLLSRFSAMQTDPDEAETMVQELEGRARPLTLHLSWVRDPSSERVVYLLTIGDPQGGGCYTLGHDPDGEARDEDDDDRIPFEVQRAWFEAHRDELEVVRLAVVAVRSPIAADGLADHLRAAPAQFHERSGEFIGMGLARTHGGYFMSARRCDLPTEMAAEAFAAPFESVIGPTFDGHEYLIAFVRDRVPACLADPLTLRHVRRGVRLDRIRALLETEESSTAGDDSAVLQLM